MPRGSRLNATWDYTREQENMPTTKSKQHLNPVHTYGNSKQAVKQSKKQRTHKRQNTETSEHYKNIKQNAALNPVQTHRTEHAHTTATSSVNPARIQENRHAQTKSKNQRSNLRTN